MWLYLHNSIWTGAMSRTPMECALRIVHVHPRAPTVMRDCIYTICVDGRDESAPTPTECTLRIVHVHQHLPTYTHCDT